MTGNFDTQIPSQIPVADIKLLLKESQELAQSGRTKDALRVLEQAENNIRNLECVGEIDRELELGRIYNNRGIAFKNMKAWDKSAACYEEALLHLAGSKKDANRERIGVEINLAILRTRQKDKKKALEGFERAEKLAPSFKGKEYDELMSKILTNQVQLHLEFNEIEKAREILDRASAFSGFRDKVGRKEKQVRVSAQLGQLVARHADNVEKPYSKEYSRQAVKLFEEAGKLYTELGMWRDSLVQNLNRAEALIALGSYDDATKALERIIDESRERGEYSLWSSATAKLLDIAILKCDEHLVIAKLDEVLAAADPLPEIARKDFLESLESRLRLGGCAALVEKVRTYRSSGGRSSAE
jgi:tetratricopeptide (TPR) repeat protein